MDQAKAIEALEWWLDQAKKALDGSGQGYSYDSSPIVQAMQERYDMTRRIVKTVNGYDKLPELMSFGSSSSGGYRLVWLSKGVDMVKYAVGRLRTDSETRAILGSTAPTMAADALHPTIWDSASKRWDAGHYSDAVQRAATFLNADIQDKLARRDISDVALMQEAFSLSAPAESKPRLRWPGADDDLTVKAMRVGILNFAQGVFSAIRNPATHSTADMGRQEGLEQLAALSMLARWVDRCKVERVPDKLGDPGSQTSMRV